MDLFEGDSDRNVDFANNASKPPSGGRGGRKGKPSRKGGGRPQSAKSTKPKSSNAASVAVSKPQDSKTRDDYTRRRASRMRGAGKSTASASAPELRVVVKDTSTVNSQATNEEGRIFERRNVPVFSARSEGGDKEAIIEAKEARLLQVESRNQELEARFRHLEPRCTQLEADWRSATAELASYKAEVRAKSTAVGKAEVLLNEVCLAMASRLGRADGAQIFANKGRVLQEVHESPSEFAAMVKRNALLQMSKWEIDRAALEALAKRSRDEAEVAATVHESERADLSAHAEQLQATIQEMELERERLAKEAETAAEESRQALLAASSAEENLHGDVQAAATRYAQLRQEVVDKDKYFQGQLDRFMQYPKEAESMAEKLDKCLKSSRRERNLVALERKDFRRQLQMFQKWQTDNKELRRKVKQTEAQILTLRRQLAVAEAGLAGTSSTRKAVIGGTVDRLQRAEASARHQAHKYKELAGSRGVRLAQLETEVSSLKATVRNLRRLHEAPAHDTYEIEIARLARVSPEVLDVQQESGLSKDDMQASMAELNLLREKEEQKDALIALVRERDEFELCVKDLKARNSWLEKQVLGSPDACRSVAIDRLEAVARSEEAEVSRGAGSASAAGPGGFRGWTGADNGGGNRPVKSAVVSRLEQRLEMRERASARDGAEKVAPELTANIRRKIQFLQDCDWSIEKERERNASTKRRSRQSGGGGGVGGSGVAAAHAARATRQRPQSAQSGRGSSGAGSGTSCSVTAGLFRGGGCARNRARVSRDDSVMSVS